MSLKILLPSFTTSPVLELVVMHLVSTSATLPLLYVRMDAAGPTSRLHLQSAYTTIAAFADMIPLPVPSHVLIATCVRHRQDPPFSCAPW
jgi:hypothetical protein